VEQVMVLCQTLVAGLTMGAIYTLIAMGLNLIANATRIVNFSQGNMVTVGALVYVSSSLTAKLPLPLSLVVTVLVTALAGLFLERAIIHPMIKRRIGMGEVILATIAFASLLTNLSQLIWGKDALSAPPVFQVEAITLFGFSLLPQRLVIVAATAIIVVLTVLFFEYTYLGKAMRAVAAEKDGAWLSGINVNRMTMLIFCVSAGLSGLAGLLIGPVAPILTTMGLPLSVKGFSAAVIGGIGSGPGAVLGGLILGLAESLGAYYVSSAYSEATAIILLLMILYLRPQGLLGGGGH
jgi:branched-chain amino acid transport system permease protein